MAGFSLVMAMTLRAWRRAGLALLVVLAAASGGAASDGNALRGVALVIGNGEYEHLAKLPNPPNDARAIEEMLNRLGFETTLVTDRNARRLKRDLEGFIEDAEDADVAVLYYSGHGIEAGGQNYLVPVSADTSSLAAAADELAPLGAVVDELKARVAVTIVLLDACRTSPFPSGAALREGAGAEPLPVATIGAGLARGAAPLSGPAASADALGTVVGFAAEPGKVALDGPAGGNSPYAAAILRHLGALQGEEFGTVMRMVAEEVYLKTAGRQRPWVNETLTRLLYFGGAPEAPEGEEKEILGERRQLLLTIAALPTASRRQIEALSTADGVPLDALYGMLRALGTDAPQDPQELDRLLRGQTERLKTMLAEREALKSADAEIVRLSALADRALREGALEAAIRALDEAKRRVATLRATVDQAEADLAARRREFALVFQRSAEANAVAWEHPKAAADYQAAYDEIARWDRELAWLYKQRQAEALLAYGDRMADGARLAAALDSARTAIAIAGELGDRSKRAASTQQLGVIEYTLGLRESGTRRLEDAAGLFREALAAWDPEVDREAWAEAQNNLANALWAAGERELAPARLEQAEAAYREALARLPREENAMFWAQIQNNIGNVAAALGSRQGDVARLRTAVAAYDAALTVMTLEATPAFFGQIQNNRGKALAAIGQMENGSQSLEAALSAFDLALQGTPREHFPLTWAIIHMNAGIALEALAARESEPDVATEVRRQALAAFDGALLELDDQEASLQRALALHNSALTLQGLARLEPEAGEQIRLLGLARARQAEALSLVQAGHEPAFRTKINGALAETLELVAEHADGPERKALLEEAAARYREILAFVTPDKSTEFWGRYQSALGRTLQLLAELGQDAERAVHAREAAALQGALAARYAELGAVAQRADALHDLGYSFILLGSVEGLPAYRQAEAAYREEMHVRPATASPVERARVEAGLGNALRGIGLATGDRAALLEAKRLTESARAAIQPYDTSYNGVLDARLAEIDAGLAAVR